MFSYIQNSHIYFFENEILIYEKIHPKIHFNFNYFIYF